MNTSTIFQTLPFAEGFFISYACRFYWQKNTWVRSADLQTSRKKSPFIVFSLNLSVFLSHIGEFLPSCDAAERNNENKPQRARSRVTGAPFQFRTQDGTGSSARFNAPRSLAVDEDGNVYVADSRAIRRITPLGVVTTVAGPTVGGEGSSLRNIHRPEGLAMTGPKTLVFTSGDGVFELRLP